MIVLLNKNFSFVIGLEKTPKGPHFLAIYIYVHIQLTFGRWQISGSVVKLPD